MAPDAIHAKQLLVNQLNKKNQEVTFLESWKQDARRERAAIYANRRRMLDQLTYSPHELRATKISDKPATIEAQYKACLEQLKVQAGTQTIESWKQTAVEERRLIFATHHHICAEIKTTKPTLKKQEKSKIQLKTAMLNEINKQNPQPEWKHKEMVQRREAYEQRAQVICDIRENVQTVKQLRPCNDLLSQRKRVMEDVRAFTTVESWKQALRERLAAPKMRKHLMLAELRQGKVELVKTADARDELLADIRRVSLNAEVVPEWKVRACEQRKTALKAQRLTCLAICDGVAELKKIPNHARLMEQIRRATSTKETVAVEGWRQHARDIMSSALRAKHATLVALVQHRPLLKRNATVQRQALMDAIRSEPVPAWKAAIQAQRVAAMQAKHRLNAEITAKKTLTSRASAPEQKRSAMAEIRARGAQPLEAWREQAREQRAMQLGHQLLVHIELLSKQRVHLKATRSVEASKCAVLAQIRAQDPLPAWVEAEREMRATALHNKCNMISALGKTKPSSTLKTTKSLEQTKLAVLSDIRRCREPLEAWKEEERAHVSDKFLKKRQLNAEIAASKTALKRGLKNFHKQCDLKELALKEIRLALDNVVPVWKEMRMAKRSEAIKNKVELNFAILARGNQ